MSRARSASGFGTREQRGEKNSRRSLRAEPPTTDGGRPQLKLEAAPDINQSMIDRFSAEDLPFCPA